MELEESNELLRIVFDSARNGIAILKGICDETGRTIDFTMVLFNRRTFNRIGNIDYKGKKYSEAFPLTLENGIMKQFINTAETGVTADFETKYEGDGLCHWFHFTAVKHGDLLVVTTEDVTERKTAELALAEALDAVEKQRRFYNSLTNTTPDLVYVFDPEYKFAYANNALLNMWGKTAEDAIGKGLRENGYEEWHALMHEREIDDVVANKVTIRGTVSFPHAELGSRVYDYIFGPLFNEAGEVEAIAGITRDITDLKQAEKKIQLSESRLKSVIDQTPAPTLVLKGDDLIIEQINRPMLRLIGRGENLVGKRLIDVLPELEGQYVWEQVQSVYKEGKHFNRSEVLVPHNRNGIVDDYYYNLAYRPLIEDGKITGMVQVAIDVTEQVVARKQVEESEARYRNLSASLEQQVNERTRELKRSNEDLQQFAHVASHDLKEPVRKIKTFMGRLEDRIDDTLDEQSKKFIDRINVATNRMLTMIDGVLDYSAANADLQKPEPVDLNEVIKNIEADLEVALQKANGHISYDHLPVPEGASVLLYQLFYNLINNSIKFAQPDSPLQIAISSEMPVEEPGFCRIILWDNGIGFEPEYADKIFETFTRLNSKDRYEGTGLGLSLCKKIAERHGGTITASGALDRGAEFTVTLPMQQEKASI